MLLAPKFLSLLLNGILPTCLNAGLFSWNSILSIQGRSSKSRAFDFFDADWSKLLLITQQASMSATVYKGAFKDGKTDQLNTIYVCLG